VLRLLPELGDSAMPRHPSLTRHIRTIRRSARLIARAVTQLRPAAEFPAGEDFA
jgi:hypothetical protein